MRRAVLRRVLHLAQEAPADENLLSLHLQQPPPGEVVQRPGDRLPRGADQACDLLLRRPLLDEEASVHRLSLLLGQVADDAGHPGVDVEQRQVADHLVRVAEAARHLGQDAQGGGRMCRQVGLERLAVEAEELRILQVDYVGGSGLPVEQRHLAEEVTRLHDAEDDLPAGLAVEDDLHLALGDHEERVARLFLAHDQGARLGLLVPDALRQIGDRLRRQLLEDGDLPQELGVVQCGLRAIARQSPASSGARQGRLTPPRTGPITPGDARDDQRRARGAARRPPGFHAPPAPRRAGRAGGGGAQRGGGEAGAARRAAARVRRRPGDRHLRRWRLNMDELVLGGHRFTSRLVVGTGKYKDFPTMSAALQASGAGMVTVAVRRLDLKARGEASLLHWIPKDMVLLPNTAGCFTAEDAIRTCRLARELQLGGERPLVKLEVLSDPKLLLPDGEETLRAAKVLVAEGFTVLPYTNDDPVLARKLEDAGCAAVMPLGAPIGSGLGIRNPYNLQMILDQAKVPVIVDAGVGTASDCALCMELGVSGLLVNTAISGAKDPVAMATAMKLATEAGRLAWLAGRIPRKLYGSASSPLAGVIGAA